MLRRVLALLLLASPLAVPVAHAQEDDWGVTKDPFSKEIRAKWKKILEKDPSDAAALKKLIDLYSRHSKVENLIAEYEAELKKKPGSFALNMILGHLHRNRSQVDAALGYYEAAAKLEPRDHSVHVARAELYRQQRKNPESIAAYEAALPLARGNKEKKQILRALADMSLDAKDIAKARKYYEDYIALDPSDVTARIDLADALSKHGLHKESLDEYKAALARLSTDPQRKVEVLARIGGEQEALGKADDAIETYRQAMALTQKGHYLRKELTERIIDIHRKRQDLRTLIAWYEKNWSQGSRGHFEWDVLARLYEETGEQDKALESYRKAVKSAPYELDTQRRLIALLERAGRDDEALRQYEQVIKVAPGEPRFQLELAERYHKSGDKKKALEMAKAIAGRFPDDAGVHGALADLYSRWGEEQLALKEYEILVKIEPNDDTHLVNLGEQWFQRNDRNKAIEIWKRIAAPKTPEAYARLAEVYAEHDMSSDAIDMYLKAIALRPKDPTLHRGYATVQERNRQDDKAIEAWDKVLEYANVETQKPLRREARTRIIAILHRKQGNHLLLKIQRTWKPKFEGTPPDIDAGYFAAEGSLKLGRFEDAEAYLKKLLDINPRDFDAKQQLVNVYKSQLKYDEAIALLKKLVEEQPGREREYYTQISELELKKHGSSDDEAIAYAKLAIEKGGASDPQAHERLAEIYARGNSPDEKQRIEDHKKAVELYRKAIELNPRNFKVHQALARLHIQWDETREAAKLYREIIRRGNDEETIRDAARRAINLEEVLGTLGDLEREVAPLAFLFANKATYRKILVDIYDRYVDPLVARARRGDEAAKKELARLGEHGLKPLLEALADHNDPAQQKVAVRVLGHLGNKNAAPPLVKLALEVPETSTQPQPGGMLVLDPQAGLEMAVRVEALISAGRLGDPRTIPQLVELLGHREVALREAAAWALGRTRDKRAVEPLIKALGDTRGSVQAMACLGLAHTADRKALDKVAEAVKDTSRGVEARAACAWALGVAGSSAHVPVLAAVVSEGNDEVQAKAAWALGRIGDAKARPALLGAYWSRKESVRSSVLWALARLDAGGADTTPIAPIDVSMGGDKIDYRAVIRALVGDLPEAKLSPSVIRGHDKDVAAALDAALGRHRDLAARVLRDLDARDDGLALGELTARLDGLETPARADVEKSLTAIGQALATRIDALCEHRDAEVRGLAVSVLAKIGDARAAGRLEKALADPNRQVRLSALGAIDLWARRSGGADASLETLARGAAKRLGSDEWEERAAAARTLGRLGAAADGKALTGALGDVSPFVREAAARALGELKRSDAVPALLGATEDSVAEVRLAAVTALVATADSRAKARLADLAQSDPDPRVRAAAAQR